MSLFNILLESKRRIKRFAQQGWDKDLLKHVDELYEDEDFFVLMLKFHYMLDVYENEGQEAFRSGDDKRLNKIIDSFDISVSDTINMLNQFISNLEKREKEFANSINYVLSLPEASGYTIFKDKGKYKRLDTIGLELHEIAEENKENQKNKDRSTNEGKEIMRTSDGWLWYLLPKEYSRIEAEKMSHSGNLTSYQNGDKYYSLRNSKKEPFLSFITNDNMIVDVKGRFNEKPSDEYHEAIVELIIHEGINGIDHRETLDADGSIYRPDLNFFFDDLDYGLQKEILEYNPDFKTS